MSKVDLAGYNLKEWSLIILIFILGIAVAVFVYSYALAVHQGSATITISGDIDVGQFVGVVIGIAMVATVLISQQLTSKNQAAAVAQTDKVWLEEANNKPGDEKPG